MKEPKKIPLSDNPRCKEPTKLPLTKNYIDSMSDDLWTPQTKNENNLENNSESIQPVDPESID